MNFFRDTRLWVKAVIPQIVLAALAGGLVLYARGTLLSLAEDIRILTEVQVVRLEHILAMNIDTNEASIVVRNIILDTKGEHLDEFRARYDTAMGNARAALTNLDRIADTAERRAANEGLRTNLIELATYLDRGIALRAKGDVEAAAKTVVFDASPTRAQLRRLIQNRTAILRKEFEALREATAQAESRAEFVLVGFALVGLVLAVGLTFTIVIFGISRPLGRLVSVLQRMARGEVDARIEEAARGDEIGAVGKAVDDIKEMVARTALEQAEMEHLAQEVVA